MCVLRPIWHPALPLLCVPGAQVACAAVLHSLLARLHRQGVVEWTAQVMLPANPTDDPHAVLTGTGKGAPEGARAVTGCELVAELLEQLKRAYWSWDWPVVRTPWMPKWCPHLGYAASGVVVPGKATTHCRLQ